MDIVLLISGLVQIVIAVIIGVLFIYAVFQLWRKLIHDVDGVRELEKNNIAISILNGAIILSVMLIVKDTLEPAATVLSNTLTDPNATFISYLETAAIMCAQIAVSGVIAFIGVYIALIFFMWLTRDLDEMAEIKKNNVAVSILVAVVIISMSLMLQNGIQTILDALIPFPPVSITDFGTF